MLNKYLKKIKSILIPQILIFALLISLSGCRFTQHYKNDVIKDYFNSFSENEYLVSEKPYIIIQPKNKTGVYKTEKQECGFEIKFPITRDFKIDMEFDDKTTVSFYCDYYDENMMIFKIVDYTNENKFNSDITTFYFHRQQHKS